ncbi:PTS system mannose/fructose/N-acetylgalactosamine-transporter subunit IIB [Alicyclobacillus shizuokensis]|uniref:PTS system mannose/fructose/N-acetylgalactosamine-transporter subunit IIB n=1 Tax=Alicyclobacillus shizuokensis TaxID=392014 RepID=UPI000AFCADAF|nr:PTS sugar transporter subunit IIB [Alicyclobacillus shizuokensis]MCL6624994.1 PTS sugar transporter subunit IIB [Alicyclobacillus shizuokensis]
MPVKHLRIDNRLIHGQVTATWVQSIGANHILVVNDQVARDPIQKVLLPKAARGVKTSVLSVEEAVAYVQDPSHEKDSILMVVKLPSDALRVLEGGVRPAQVNVGNQAPTPGTDYKMVTKSIAVTAADTEIYKSIAAKGFTVTAQMLPTDSKLDLLELIRKKGF